MLGLTAFHPLRPFGCSTAAADRAGRALLSALLAHAAAIGLRLALLGTAAFGPLTLLLSARPFAFHVPPPLLVRGSTLLPLRCWLAALLLLPTLLIRGTTLRLGLLLAATLLLTLLRRLLALPLRRLLALLLSSTLLIRGTTLRLGLLLAATLLLTLLRRLLALLLRRLLALLLSSALLIRGTTLRLGLLLAATLLSLLRLPLLRRRLALLLLNGALCSTRRIVTEATAFARGQRLQLRRPLRRPDLVAGFAHNRLGAETTAAEILRTQFDRAWDRRRPRQHPWPHIKCADGTPDVGRDHRRRNPRIDGEVATFAQNHGLVHHDRVAHEGRIVAHRENDRGKSRSSDEVACAREYPHIGLVAIFDDEVVGGQRRPADIVSAVPPLYKARPPFVARDPRPTEVGVIDPATIVIGRPAPIGF